MAFSKGKTAVPLGSVIRPAVPSDGQHIKAEKRIPTAPGGNNLRQFRSVIDFSDGPKLDCNPIKPGRKGRY